MANANTFRFPKAPGNALTFNRETDGTAALAARVDLAGGWIGRGVSFSTLAARVDLTAGFRGYALGFSALAAVVHLTAAGTFTFDPNRLTGPGAVVSGRMARGAERRSRVSGIWKDGADARGTGRAGWDGGADIRADISGAWQQPETRRAAGRGALDAPTFSPRAESRPAWSAKLPARRASGRGEWSGLPFRGLDSGIVWPCPPNKRGRARFELPAGVLRSLTLAAPFVQGTPRAARWVLAWGDGRLLLPGRTPRPEPPEPPPGWVTDNTLTFIPGWAAPGLLVFARRGLFAGRVVPVRKVYIMQDSASLIRLSDGEPIPAVSLTVSTDVDSWLWSGSAALARASDLALVDPWAEEPSEVRMTINGVDFDFVVLDDPEATEQRGGSGEPDDAATLRGRSLSAYLDDPFAPVQSWTNANARNAAQLAEDTLPFGTSLTWTAADWLVAAGAWSFRGTPAAALARLAEAAGASLASARTGIGLTVAPRYPVLPWDWAGETPWGLVPRAYLTSQRPRWVRSPAYNGVYVAGDRGGILARVIREGTAGDALAPQITDDLTTHADMARARGGVALAQSGRYADVTLTLPVGPELGIIPLGVLLAVDDTPTQWRGLVRSVTVSATVQDGIVDVMQTVVIERRE